MEILSFKKSIECLFDALNKTSSVVGDANWAWTPTSGTSLESAKGLIQGHVTNIWYGAKGYEVKTLQGAILTTSSGFECITDLNNAKETFKREVFSLKELSGRSNKKGSINIASDEIFRNRFVAKALKDLGHSNLSLLEAYRFIPCFKDVEYLSFTWSLSNKSDFHIIYDDVIKLIVKKTQHIEPDKTEFYIDRVRSTGLNNFLIRRNVAPHSRCNVLFADKTRKTIVSHSPIFLFQETPPRVRWIEMEECLEKNKKRRTDNSEIIEIIPEFNLFYKA